MYIAYQLIGYDAVHRYTVRSTVMAVSSTVSSQRYRTRTAPTADNAFITISFNFLDTK
jgi:hypothetical protein